MFFLQIIAEEEPESPPLNYELDMATSSASSAKIETNVVAVASEQQPNGLEDQERRTRIALLENQQAELETEIRLLKQCSKSFNRSSPYVTKSCPNSKSPISSKLMSINPTME